MTRIILLLGATIGVASSAPAQQAGAGQAGRRPLLARADEIALARSAAPASVAAGARIYVLTEAGYVVADSGTTATVCAVFRTWPTALEPECLDAEAAASILPMELRRTELYHAGVTPAEANRVIAEGLAEGKFRMPTRLAVAYMMSAGQRLVGDDGRPAGRWKPHLMIYYPYLTNEAVGHHGNPDATAGLVVDPGRPTANLMVVVPDFVPVATARSSP